jgi:large conductance mechanosensitive channel
MDPIPRVTALEPARRAAALYDEFKQFAFKGNVVDLAVGVIIGAAFGKIVDSLVKSVIMPLIGALLPGGDGFKGLAWTINGQRVPYGEFVAEVVNFLIVAAALFLFVRKFLGWMVRTKEQAPPPPSKQEELLTEIRDLLKSRPQAPPGDTPGA